MRQNEAGPRHGSRHTPKHIDAHQRTDVPLAALSALNVKAAVSPERVAADVERRQRLTAVLTRRHNASALDRHLGIDRREPVDKQCDYWHESQMDLGLREREYAGRWSA